MRAARESAAEEVEAWKTPRAIGSVSVLPRSSLTAFDRVRIGKTSHKSYFSRARQGRSVFDLMHHRAADGYEDD
jgi:hypothetical protein